MRILLIVHHRLWRAAYRSRFIAIGLAKQGHDVTLMVTADKERWRFRTTRINGFELVETPDITFGRLRSGWDPVNAVRKIRWLKRYGSGYDLIHLFETRPATIFPGLWLKRRLNVPLVIDWIDWWGRGGIIKINRPFWYRALFGWFETFFEEHFRPYADATTVISYGLAERAVSLGVKRQTILHMRNGVDLDLFSSKLKREARRRLNLVQDSFLIGYAAQDTFFDLDPMFKGLKRLIDSGANAEIVMSGYAPDRVKASIVRFGLEPHARFLGYLSWEDYPYFLPACDVLACPFPATVYNLGRWPGKFSEYLAAGRPVVFNPEGDLADFAEDSVPGIACAFNADAFAQAFRTLHENPTLREELGAVARARACREFDWEAIIGKLANFYEETVSHWAEQNGGKSGIRGSQLERRDISQHQPKR